MPKGLRTSMGMLAGILGTAALAGCGLHARTYVKVRKRVDQEMKGNFGYLAGTPVPEDRSRYKKTRKMYVLEVTKDPPPVEVVVIEKAVRRPSAAETTPSPLPSPAAGNLEERRFFIPETSSAEGMETASDPVLYTVRKGDTLQKISKKFYGFYSRWPRIYEANKDVIPDPNRLSEGMRLRIPPAE